MRPSLPVTLGLISFSHLIVAQNVSCTTNQPVVSAPRNNPWKALSEDESAVVNDILQQRFNLTGNQGSSQDSFVVQVTLLNANKTDVIAYLDGNATQLARYARATVMFGATNSTDPWWQEYMIGPLPATNSTKIELLTYPFNNQKPGRTNVHPVYSPTDGSLFQTRLSSDIENITKQLWNSVRYPCPFQDYAYAVQTLLEGSVGLRFGVPFWNEDGKIISWVGFFTSPDPSLLSSPTLLALGVSIQLDLTGRNWEDWKVIGWYSRGVFYNSTEEFSAAISSPGFKELPPNVSGNWSSTDKQGASLPLDDLPPPISKAQGSQRFNLDVKENYVSWMDFGFYFSVSPDLGLSLFDIRYKNKRLIYELSLQEALTHYTGSDPFASQAVFFDSETGFGSTLQPLVRGYDCPSHATYLNSTFSEGNSTMTQTDAICLFEYDAGYPIRRHSFSPAAPHTSVAKNILFTMRTISTIGNYDFLISYDFYYDGAIEVSARASGYILAAYWEDDAEYGFHIQDHLSGSLHDHVLTFKADFDIFGTKNSVQKVELAPTSKEYPWSNGKVHNTFKATRSFMTSESSVDWPGNDVAMYAIVNKDTPNRFGEFPGYRIRRSAGTSHLVAINSTNVQKAAAFATHDFYITKQKDTEPRAADAWNQFAPEDPLVDFEQFLDGEKIEQEDVVLWFNLGMHHMPHTGDLPTTMFTSAHSAMRFEPLNYLDGDPSVASNQQVRMDYNEDGSLAFIENFGKKVVDSCSV